MGGDRQSGQGTEADLGAAAAPQRRGEAASSAGNGSTSESVSVSFVSVESSETVMVRGNGADGPGKSVGDAEPGSLPGSLGAAGVGGNGSSGVHLNMGVFMIPHPDKAHKGGEDAFFLCEDCGGGAAGVADGVGGWAEQGVDSGQYSRALCENTRAACHGVQPELNSPKAALKVAHAQTEGLGSSTACVLMMGADGTLHIANLGDSGVMIVREGKPVFVTPQQQHDFNFPFQLGSEPFNDPPESADDFAVKVQPGDVVVAATDGLWDNMYVDEVANLIADSRSRGHSPREAAREVATRAQVLAADDRYLSPFAYSALQLGYVFIGGKMDDITVLVSYVEEGKAKL
ncbi:unnamed protein product [Pedinophyceae sp. YPF-701]|nr:unnamed protein product [Pedinophyceae sp. YPF-701]